MMDQITAASLANKQEIDAYTILREYIQIRFLDIFFRVVKPNNIFQRGTALRLLYGSERFSEDLDFTVPSKENPFKLAKQTMLRLKSEIVDISIKQMDTTLTGTSAKFSLNGFFPSQPLTIKLDFLSRTCTMPQVAADKTNTPSLVFPC